MSVNGAEKFHAKPCWPDRNRCAAGQFADRRPSVTCWTRQAVHWHSSSPNQAPTLLVSPLIRLIWQCDECCRNGLNGCCDWARQPNEGILQSACTFLITPAPRMSGNQRRQGCWSEDWPVKKTQSVQLMGVGGEESVAGDKGEDRGVKADQHETEALLKMKWKVLWLVGTYS